MKLQSTLISMGKSMTNFDYHLRNITRLLTKGGKVREKIHANVAPTLLYTLLTLALYTYQY